jgi:hypothetical protein
MKIPGIRGGAAVVALAALALVPARATSQQSYTNFPLGLSLADLLAASGLPRSGDPEGWQSLQSGSSSAVPVHYASTESSLLFPGVSIDSATVVLRATMRAELENRGALVMDRSERPAGPPGIPRAPGGDAWTIQYRVAESGEMGWVTLLLLPEESGRIRLFGASVEARDIAPYYPYG